VSGVLLRYRTPDAPPPLVLKAKWLVSYGRHRAVAFSHPLVKKTASRIKKSPANEWEGKKEASDRALVRRLRLVNSQRNLHRQLFHPSEKKIEKNRKNPIPVVRST